MKRFLPYLLPILLLNLVSGFSFWYHQRAGQLNEQLAYSVNVLGVNNESMAKHHRYALYHLELAVGQGHNQPADVARLRRAQALHAQVGDALRQLRELDSLVRRAAGTATNPTGMRQPTQPVFIQPFKLITQRWQPLRGQLAACFDTLHQLSPAAALAQLPPPAAGTTVVQALADLGQAQYQLLTTEHAALQQLEQAIPSYALPPAVFTALATAESDVVAPGHAYRARLLLTSNFPAALHTQMTCNGRPVPVDSLGIGRVRFRAPHRPGPAAWVGTARFNLHGRDTTFVVRVPYRVAAR